MIKEHLITSKLKELRISKKLPYIIKLIVQESLPSFPAKQRRWLIIFPEINSWDIVLIGLVCRDQWHVNDRIVDFDMFLKSIITVGDFNTAATE